MNDCIFCKIIAGEIPADKIYEDEKVFSILDLRPVNRGHALVMHKTHSKDFLSSSDEILADLMTRVRKIAEAIIKTTGATGFNIHINNGESAGQVVFHLHIHIIPRYSGDGLKMFPHKDSEKTARQALAEAISNNLK